MNDLDRSSLNENRYELTAFDFAIAERVYAIEQRLLAAAIEGDDPGAAADLRLEADICELWAEHILDGSPESRSELRAMKDELCQSLNGGVRPRGGLRILLHGHARSASKLPRSHGDQRLSPDFRPS